MVESPQRIWIEADDECPYFYEAHELHDVEQDVIEYVRADLYAALEAKLADLAAENERLKQEIAATQEKLIRANDELIQRNSKALSRTGAVKVKPLEWTVETPTWCEADGLGKLYRVLVQPSGKATLKHGSFDTGVDYPSLEAAKAVSQADYERRILSALEADDERA